MVRTPRLLLRLARPQDAAAVLELMRDPVVDLWNPARGVVDLQTAQRWCEDLADWAAGDHASWIVADIGTDEALGVVSLHSIDRARADAEIGYRVAAAARGRGIATEALAAATAWAFANLSLTRVRLVHAVDNAPSCAVAGHAGYVLEGVTRQSYVYGDGRRHDEHLHARLAGDAPP